MSAIPFLRLDETGTYVEGGGYASVLPEGAFALAEGVKPSQFNQHHVVGGTFVLRPSSPVPVEIPGGWRLPACPPGTQVMIHDRIGKETLTEVVTDGSAADFDFSLADPGSYEIEVASPLPHVPTKTILEVS
jgi:hypothetical protein